MGHLQLVRNFEELFKYADLLYNCVLLTLGVPAYKGVKSIFEKKGSKKDLQYCTHFRIYVEAEAVEF